MRMLPTKAHGLSAFELVFKQEPAFPALVPPTAADQSREVWATEQDEQDMVEKLLVIWNEI